MAKIFAIVILMRYMVVGREMLGRASPPLDFEIWCFSINFLVEKCCSLSFELLKWNFITTWKKTFDFPPEKDPSEFRRPWWDTKRWIHIACGVVACMGAECYCVCLFCFTPYRTMLNQEETPRQRGQSTRKLRESFFVSGKIIIGFEYGSEII